MAGVKKTGKRKRTFRRRARRAFKRVPRNQVVVKQTGGFPDRAFVTFKYSQIAIALGTGASIGYFVTRTLNDPTNNNAALPLGWAQWADVYDSYMVRGCKLKAIFTNTSTTIPVRALICPVDSDASIGTLPGIIGDVLLRNQYSKTKYLSVAGGGKDVQVISRYVSMKRLAGLGKISLANETYQGYAGGGNSSNTFTQPVALWNWAYGAATTTGASLANNQVYVDIEITFYVQFYEKLQSY